MNDMTPTVAQILDSVSASLDEHVRPVVTDPYARSVLLTIDNLLRYAAIRAEREAELLAEDNDDLAAVLARMAALLAADASQSAALAAALAATHAEIGTAVEGFPSVARLSQRATRLRTRLDELLAALIAAREPLGQQPGCREARNLARDYLSRMLRRNAALVDPAFVSDRR